MGIPKANNLANDPAGTNQNQNQTNANAIFTTAVAIPYPFKSDKSTVEWALISNSSRLLHTN